MASVPIFPKLYNFAHCFPLAGTKRIIPSGLNRLILGKPFRIKDSVLACCRVQTDDRNVIVM